MINSINWLAASTPIYSMALKLLILLVICLVIVTIVSVIGRMIRLPRKIIGILASLSTIVGLWIWANYFLS